VLKESKISRRVLKMNLLLENEMKEMMIGNKIEKLNLK
jgi:hypothetical protein